MKRLLSAIALVSVCAIVHAEKVAMTNELTTSWSRVAPAASVATETMTNPTNMTFRLLATRRFMLDNEVTISEFVPGSVARPSLQNAEIEIGRAHV